MNLRGRRSQSVSASSRAIASASVLSSVEGEHVRSCRRQRLACGVGPSRRLASFGAGRSTRRARLGKASVLLGIAMAATNRFWKFGSIAVSIFSMRRTTPSISARAARLRSAMRAPVPAALPALATLARSQSGMRPSVIA